MRSGWTRFYADEDIEEAIVIYLRARRYHVDSARELGFAGKDDQFQLQEARRRKAILLTRDLDFLNHRIHGFDKIRDTAVVILRSEDKPETQVECGHMLLALQNGIGRLGTKGLFGHKIELRGFRVVFHAQTGGRILTEDLDMRELPED